VHHGGVPPVDPPPTPWQLVGPPDDYPDDLWAAGADLEPGTLLSAYRLGLFPMPLDDRVGWFSPAERAVVPLEPFVPSRSLRRANSFARTRLHVSCDFASARCVVSS